MKGKIECSVDVGEITFRLVFSDGDTPEEKLESAKLFEKTVTQKILGIQKNTGDVVSIKNWMVEYQ